MIMENDDLVAFLDLNPHAPTHLLIVPRKHIPSLDACTKEDALLLGKIQLAAVELAKQYKLDSFRLVTNNGKSAGQTVEHLHYHFLGGRRMAWPPG